MSMDVTFLGTGAAYPSPTRGASALVLRCEGECWLFDCGEGTQTQLMKSQLKAGRITKIFITHLHGDHFFGLPGLLCTISLQSGSVVTKQPIEIYGPAGLRDFIWRTMELSHTELVFPYVVHELVPTADQCPTEEQKEFTHVNEMDSLPKEGQGRTILLDSEENSYLLVDDEQFVVKAFRLFHRIPSFGFSVVEKKRPGKLNAQKLKDLDGLLYAAREDGCQQGRLMLRPSIAIPAQRASMASTYKFPEKDCDGQASPISSVHSLNKRLLCGRPSREPLSSGNSQPSWCRKYSMSTSSELPMNTCPTRLGATEGMGCSKFISESLDNWYLVTRSFIRRQFLNCPSELSWGFYIWSRGARATGFQLRSPSQGCGVEPRIGSHTQHVVRLGFSLSLSLCFPSHPHIPSYSKIKK
ncbi:zinc phosphodiesterase ELAC protein 1 isoform X2 [Canis lupus baileyi]|nr:zinc phosphodiesterase ELAC protein 1 isoform X3 [Canis lupus familiaris]XP_038381915.1 zinc phosphodiesterase ELAC protein 1 isoform X3 [Canis lupus familiaris]